jgi:hypothetical protein
MSSLDEVNDFLLGGGAKAFPFDKQGDMVTGEIVDAVKRQQTSLDTGAPQFWDDGNPKMMLVITLQTSLRDDDEDDGKRTVYLRGGNPQVAEGKGTSSLKAVQDAVKKSGSKKGIELGATLSLAWTGVAPKKGGLNPAKLYSAAFKPAALSIDIDEMA